MPGLRQTHNKTVLGHTTDATQPHRNFLTNAQFNFSQGYTTSDKC